MPDSWSTTVEVISGQEKVTLDSVRDRIISESIRRNERGETSGAALTVQRGRESQKGENRGRSKSKGRSKSRTRGEAECWNCGKKGHLKRDCKAPKKAKKRGDESNSVNAATKEDSDDALVLCVDSPIESWILDSGASFHSTSCKELMKNFVSGEYGKVYLADGKPLEITGKGDVHIKSSNGYRWTLHDVRYIPGLKKNLISVGQLDCEGYRTIFGEGSWRIVKGAIVVARGTKVGTLYLTDSSGDLVALAGAETNPILWHNRLGHMSDKGLKVLALKGLLPTMQSVETDFCEDCVLGKQKRVSFSMVGRERKEERLALVHTDVWGPEPVQSQGGSRSRRQRSQDVGLITLNERKRVSFASGRAGTLVEKLQSVHKIVDGSGLTQMLNKEVEVVVADVDADRATMGAIGDPCTTMKKVALPIRLRVKRSMTVMVEGVIAEATIDVVPCMGHDTIKEGHEPGNSCGVGVVSRCVAGANAMVKWLWRHIKRFMDGDRGVEDDETLSLRKIAGALNPADMLTKVVTTDKLRLCIASVGLNH